MPLYKRPMRSSRISPTVRVLLPGRFQSTPTLEVVSSLSVAMVTSVLSCVGTVAKVRGRALVRRGMPAKVRRMSCSSVAGSASPTATTAMRSGRYQSCQKRRTGAELAVSRISGLPMGNRSA